MDLLVLSEVRWGYFRTRKQFLLARFPAPWRVHFAQPPAAGADDPWEPRQEGRVTVFTVPFLKPGTTSALYNAVSATAVGRAALELGAEVYLQRMLARLGAALDISAPNMAVTLDRMVERGWVERVRSTQDRRAQQIHLTAQGAELVQRAEKIAATMEHATLRVLSPAERALLIELLMKVAGGKPGKRA